MPGDYQKAKFDSTLHSVEKLQSYTTIKLVWPSFEETGAMDHQPADASRIPTPRNFDAIIFNCCHQTHQHKRY
uniref:Uncharacterized protein n=1 Tax=Leersia perrieri TaxID=77586 RepID=A0A0D9XLY2_9ORYZ